MKANKEPLYLKFHRESRIDKPLKLPGSKWPESWKRIGFKGYPRFERYNLNKSAWDVDSKSLVDSVRLRSSDREFGHYNQISADDLSYLLLGGSIISVGNDVFYDSRRTYPSAGARYPLEIYPIILNSDDFKNGIYHYHVRSHSLEYLWPTTKKEIKECFPAQDFVCRCDVIFVISAVMTRATVKYLERGYRFALLEAGHLAQNICLLACSKGLKICPVGGFNDRKLTKLMDFNKPEELILYTLAASLE